VADHPKGGLHYPRSTGELQSWFGSDGDCLDYLDWMRWPQGFVCPRCENHGGWLRADGSYKCASCKKETAVTAGTLFDRRRSPLTVWFAVCWAFVSQKDGVSALSLQRTLEIGSYQTAWAMLHRLRAVMVRPGRDRLTGTVEMDETLIGGVTPGKRGRTPGAKVLVGVAVERKEPRGFGRCRLSVLPDASAPSLRTFLADHVEPGSTVVTDGWPPYTPALAGGYSHERHVAPGELAHQLLPGVHRVASLLDRWLLGTHQGAVHPEHLPAYLDEFTFRFNRRRSRSRGLVFYRVLELAVGHDPVRFRQLVANSRSKKVPPAPPERRGHPPSLDRPRADRPWRAGN